MNHSLLIPILTHAPATKNSRTPCPNSQAHFQGGPVRASLPHVCHPEVSHIATRVCISLGFHVTKRDVLRTINRFEITVECEGEISQWGKELRVEREEGLVVVGAVSPLFTMFWSGTPRSLRIPHLNLAFQVDLKL